MFRRIAFSALIVIFSGQASLQAHCQMPCGIYHDDMVYDQIDQYVETMAKGLTILMDSKFSTLAERNEFIRWTLLKENSSNEAAQLLTTFFLQQKIKPDEENTTKRVLSAHKLLFLLTKIKQTVDYAVLNDFYEEWERFKLMFHIEGYECKMEQKNLKEWAIKRAKAEIAARKQGQSVLEPDRDGEHVVPTQDQEHFEHDHDQGQHSHDHPHPH